MSTSKIKRVKKKGLIKEVKRLSKPTKKPLSKMTSSINKAWADVVAKSLESLDSGIISSLVNVKPPTKAQKAKWEKERIAHEKKEAKRRAKKITMTVGEYEDALENERDCYRDY